MKIDYKDNSGQRTIFFIDENGKEDGLYLMFYHSGKPRFKINYKNGKFHGSVRSWYNNDELFHDLEYDNGKQINKKFL